MSANGRATSPRADGIPYFEAKRAMERAVPRVGGLGFVILRPSFVFGDGGALADVPPPCAPLARRRRSSATGRRGSSRSGSTTSRALSRPSCSNGPRPLARNTSKLGGPEIVTWNDFWARLKKAAGVRRPKRPRPVLGDARPGDAAREAAESAQSHGMKWRMLQAGDNVVTGDDAAAVLGLELVPLDEQLRRVA